MTTHGFTSIDGANFPKVSASTQAQETESIDWTALFDPNFYVSTNPDLRGVDLLQHYNQYGWREQRVPHPLFDPYYYSRQASDIEISEVNPLRHYLLYGASQGYNPHPLFDTKYYLANNQHLLETKQNPLLHYLSDGTEQDQNPHPLFQSKHFRNQLIMQGINAAGANLLSFYLQNRESFCLEPNEYFNGAYYLRKYLDVHKSGINPLIHYVLFGAAERRYTHSNFDLSLYISQFLHLRKSRENVLTHYFTVGAAQNADCNNWFTEKSTRRQQSFLDLSKSGKPNILLVSHAIGGGTEEHLKDLVHICGEKSNFFLLKPVDKQQPILELSTFSDENRSLSFKMPLQFDVLVAFIRKLVINKAHVHHILGMEKYAKNIIEQLEIPFDLTIHDYYLLSPGYHLVNEHGVFAGEPDDGTTYRDKQGVLDTAENWRLKQAWLLNDAQRVIVPSQDTLKRFTKYFPNPNYIMVPHPQVRKTIERQGIRVGPILLPESLRIAVLGSIKPHKGLDILEACALRAKNFHLPIEFIVIGEVEATSQLSRQHILAIGKYEKAEIMQLLRIADPHIVWFPAQCPETFSYTLSEALHANLPVATTDLGAFPERLANRPWTWIKDWRTSAAEWCDFFLKLREEEFSRLTEVTFIDWHNDNHSARFYTDDYIN